jgi:hypothetical protein
VIPVSQPVAQTPSEADNNLRWLRIAVALAVIALVYFYRIDRPLVWGDEAETGIEARNILMYGYPIAYDGRNVSIYDNGAQLNNDLVYKKIPWASFYLGALSMAIFGDNTAGLRILFAFVGLLSFLPIYAVLKSRIKYPDIIAALVLISPQVVLFQRNARYFSILILLYAVLVWHLSFDFKSAKTRFIVALLALVLFFHTHSLVAICTSISLILYSFFFRRELLKVYSISSGIAFLSWLIWYVSLGSPLTESPITFWMITTDFGLWLKLFFEGLAAVIVDLDVVGCLPILLWIAIVGFLFSKGRAVVLNTIKDPLFAFVFLNILVQALITAALFGYETPDRHSLLRYMPHLVVFALIACFFALNAIIPKKGLYLAVCGFAVAFNFLTFSLLAKPFSRNMPVSWALPVYSEIISPKDTVWDNMIARLRDESEKSTDRDAPIVALPQWTQGMTVFYLGDRYLVSPMLNPGAGECEQAIRKVMGDESFFKLVNKPKWVLDIVGQLKPGPEGYTSAAVFPSHQSNPDQGIRPELTRHDFYQPEAVINSELFRLKE